MVNLSNDTAYVITTRIEDKNKFLSRFWDVSKNMWTENWRQAELFDTNNQAEVAFKNLKRFGHEMTIREATIQIN